MTAQAIPSRGGHRTMLGVILLFGLIVRLGWALTRPTSDAALNQLPDQHDYLSLARSLLHGDGFVFRDPRFPDELKAFRTPGYPVFLAMCGANARIARGVQALLDTSTILAIYIIARKLVRPPNAATVALAAAAIVAANPFVIYFSGLLLTETLFTATLAWAMVLLVGSNGRIQRVQWLAAGLLLTTSLLVRPSGIALPIALGVATVLLPHFLGYQRSRDMDFAPMHSDVQVKEDARFFTPEISRHGLEADVTGESLVGVGGVNPPGNEPSQLRRLAFQGCLAAVAMLLLTLLTILPWTIRNHAVLGRWIPLDTNAGFTLYDGFNPRATGASDQTFVKRMPELQGMNELQRSDYLGKQAREYMAQHPGRVILLAVAKLARTWSPITLSSEFGQFRYQLVAAAFSIPFDLLLITGLFRTRLLLGAKAFLLTPALYFSIVHALTVGSLRYRIPAEPPMAILAAVALVAAAEKMRFRSKSKTQALGRA